MLSFFIFIYGLPYLFPRQVPLLPVRGYISHREFQFGNSAPPHNPGGPRLAFKTNSRGLCVRLGFKGFLIDPKTFKNILDP